jgi:fatty-acyl-CoA synthase
MTEPPPARPHRSPGEVVQTARRHTARLALLLAILAVGTLAFAPFGVREQMFDLDYAVRTLATGWAPNLALIAVILGGLAFLAAIIVPPRRDRISSLLAVALGAGVMAVSGQVRTVAVANPPIHDVATDWTDPLLFGPKVFAARGEFSNSVEADPKVQPQPQAPNLTGTRVAEVNARTCPGAVPVILTGSVADAYAKARAALVRERATLVTDNPAGGRLEALAITRFLKLPSDVLIRVKPEGAGARVDIRSSSRTGVADLGENCRRVTRLRTALSR